MLIQLELGMNALDAVIYKIRDKTDIPYVIIRTSFDLIYVVLGTYCGGIFGAGTICSVLLTGSMVGMFVSILKAGCGRYEIRRAMEKVWIKKTI